MTVALDHVPDKYAHPAPPRKSLVRMAGENLPQASGISMNPRRNIGGRTPGEFQPLFGGAQAAIQAEGDDRTDQAQAGGQRDEPEIMVVGQAGEKAHEATDLGGTVCRRSGRCLIRRARTGLTKRYDPF